jgi:hypothetical protein
MLEHLLNPEFQDAHKVSTPTLLSAQASTADLLLQLGSPEHVIEEDEAHKAREAFAAVTSPDAPQTITTGAVLKLRTPEAVKHLAGMLSQYDWDFVEQAKELRGYVVAKLLEETRHPDAKIRLRSLELVGKLTEVGSFTEKIEVTKVSLTDNELDAKIKEKLSRFMGVVDVVEVESRDEEVSKLGLPREAE